MLGPDGETQFLVYHAWDAGGKARKMCIDPLVWTPDGPVVDGPTSTDVDLNRSVQPAASGT